MTKKRETFLIDLLDDTDSDSADALKKLGKVSEMGQYFRSLLMRCLMIPYPMHDFENPDCNPFASFKQRSGHRNFEGAAQVLGHKIMSSLYCWTGIPTSS